MSAASLGLFITSEFSPSESRCGFGVNLSLAPAGFCRDRRALLLELPKRIVELLIEFLFAQLNAMLSEHDSDEVTRHAIGIVRTSELNHRRRIGRIAFE